MAQQKAPTDGQLNFLADMLSRKGYEHPQDAINAYRQQTGETLPDWEFSDGTPAMGSADVSTLIDFLTGKKKWRPGTNAAPRPQAQPAQAQQAAPAAVEPPSPSLSQQFISLANRIYQKGKQDGYLEGYEQAQKDAAEAQLNQPYTPDAGTEGDPPLPDWMEPTQPQSRYHP